MRVRSFVISGREQGTIITTAKPFLSLSYGSVRPRIIARVKDSKINSTLFVHPYLPEYHIACISL